MVTVARGVKVLWDGRFAIEIADGLAGSLEVRALGGKGLAELKRLGRGVKGASALLLAPSFWRANDLLAVPAIDFWVQEGLDRLISADFMGLRYNSGGIGVVGKDDPEAS